MQISDTVKTVQSLVLIVAWSWIYLIKNLIKYTGISLILFTPLMLYNSYALKSFSLLIIALLFMLIGSYIYIKNRKWWTTLSKISTMESGFLRLIPEYSGSDMPLNFFSSGIAERLRKKYLFWSDLIRAILTKRSYLILNSIINQPI